MKLHILDSDEYNEVVEITRVSETSAKGIVVQTINKQVAEKNIETKTDSPQPILVGWKLTTSEHKKLVRFEDRTAVWEAKQKKNLSK